MTLSEIKKLKEELDAICEGLWREAVEHIENEDDDFEVDGFRFIDGEVIDDILVNELNSDSYLLGCFKSWSIAEATGWPVALIEAAKKGEAYEEIGDAMGKDDVQKLADIYVRSDGYGHHFATYDGNEHQLSNGYYVFRVE